jgi:hypothetical protein
MTEQTAEERAEWIAKWGHLTEEELDAAADYGSDVIVALVRDLSVGDVVVNRPEGMTREIATFVHAVLTHPLTLDDLREAIK